jgi:hypothetical protein
MLAIGLGFLTSKDPAPVLFRRGQAGLDNQRAASIPVVTADFQFVLPNHCDERAAPARVIARGRPLLGRIHNSAINEPRLSRLVVVWPLEFGDGTPNAFLQTRARKTGLVSPESWNLLVPYSVIAVEVERGVLAERSQELESYAVIPCATS